MKSGDMVLETVCWPYGIEVEPKPVGVLLRPIRKARHGWAKKFASKKAADDLAQLRALPNRFDEEEWQW